MLKNKRGQLITAEGIDGAGKSVHIDFLLSLIKSKGFEATSTREPGGTPLGEKVRELLLHEKMNLETEALLMFASRREHIAQVIGPAMDRGEIVISDRFSDSSFAFQCGGRGLSYEKMTQLEQWVHPGLQPDLTLLFDVPTQVARARLQSDRVMDKFEMESLAFHARVRQTYLERAAQYPERFKIIDSTKSIIEIRKELVSIVDDFLDEKCENLEVPKGRYQRP